MSKRKYKNEVIAQILVEALYAGYQKTAEKYDISQRTIYRWQDKAEYDIELSELIKVKKRAFQRRWVEEAGAFISQGFKYLLEAANSPNTSPDMVHAIAGAMKIASEIITIREVLDARLAGQDRANDTKD